MTQRPIERGVIVQLDSDAEDLVRCIHLLPDVEARMRATLAEPGGHGFEVVSRATVLYCELHHRDLTDCQREARKLEDECYCTGVPVPTVSDPTGEAAVHDRVWADARELHRRRASISDDVAWIVGMVARWSKDDRVPLRDAKAKADQPLCEIHLRYGYDRPATSKKGTRVKRNGVPILSRPYCLCQWCEDTTQKLGRVPIEVEVHDHVAGKRLRVVSEDGTEADERRREREQRRPGGDAA